MQASNLKASLITACCFFIVLCSEIKSMDTASDLQETTSYKAKNTHNEGCLDSLKNDMGSNSSSVRFLLNQDENKDPETSLASYMASPVKAVIHRTYNIVDFAVKHPTQTIITTLLIAAQVTAVAADCNCILYRQNSGCNPDNAIPITYGQFPNASDCKSLTSSFTIYCYYGCF